MASRVLKMTAHHIDTFSAPRRKDEILLCFSNSPPHSEGMISYIDWSFKSRKSGTLKPEDTKNIKKMTSFYGPKIDYCERAYIYILCAIHYLKKVQ